VRFFKSVDEILQFDPKEYIYQRSSVEFTPRESNCDRRVLVTHDLIAG
jgi:hypothetical protein